MRLQTKILTMLVPLWFASSAAVLVVSGYNIRAILVESEAKRVAGKLEETASRCALALAARSESGLLPLVHDAMRRNGASYVMVLDGSGKILAHSNVSAVGTPHVEEVSARAAVREGPGYEVLATPAGPVLDSSTPVWGLEEDFMLASEKGGRRRLGAIRMGTSLAEAESARSRILARIASITFLATLVAALILGTTLRRMLLPIHELSSAADSIGKGRYGGRVVIRSSDELGELAGAFNEMSAELGRTSVSKDFLDGVIRGIPDAVFVTDLAGDVRMANPAGAAMLGRPEAAVVGRPLSAFFDPGVIEAVLGAGPVRDLESVLRSGDAREVPILVSASALRGRGGSGGGSVIVVKDLTTIKDSETALRGAYSLLSATLEATADGILVVDQDGRILRYNNKFTTMWRVPEDVISARDDRRALAFMMEQLKDPAGFLGKVQELYGNSMATSFDVLEFHDGRVFERFSQPQLVNDVCVGRVWDFRDVTERRRMQGMLAQSEKMSAVGQLAAGVAHEINNPLGVILGFAQAALRRLKPEDELVMPVRSIEREAQRCTRLVKNLLTFSRQSQARAEEIDVNEAVLSTLELVEANAKVHGVELARELGASGRVVGDRVQLQQVVVNLCNNAVDAISGRGGKVTVRTSDAGTAGGPAVRIEVEDNGVGIPEDVLQKIYNPFFTTKEIGHGTGLGLALVHEIVERHQGMISVRSLVGAGTTFVVTLPAVAGRV